MVSQQEKAIIRELAKRYNEIASLDIQIENKQRSRAINDLIPVCPVVLIDEIPWHEMDIDGQLLLQCEDAFAREIELFLRRTIFQWKYFPGDMVVRQCYPLSKSICSTGNGLSIQEHILSTEVENNIVSHEYIDQLSAVNDLLKIKMPVISADKARDTYRCEVAEDILQDILPVKLFGTFYSHNPWDHISMCRSVTSILTDIIDRPQHLHKIIDAFTKTGLSEMEQLEQLNLLEGQVHSLHCTPGYVSDLPESNCSSKPICLKDTWIRGTAQIFSSVSPAMHEEFELSYAKQLYEKCGLLYYGCCEPLDNKISLLKKITNLRKIGVSPWADVRSCAQQIGKDYVLSRKPNPAYVAVKTDTSVIRAEILDTLIAAREYGCCVEFVLKDVSTVSHRPHNLINWDLCVRETIIEFYS